MLPYELVAPATWSEGIPVCHGPCRVRTALKNRGLLRVGEGVGREGTSLHSSSGVWTVLLPLKNGTCHGDFSSVWQTPDKDSRRKGGFVVTCRSRGYSPDGRQQELEVGGHPVSTDRKPRKTNADRHHHPLLFNQGAQSIMVPPLFRVGLPTSMNLI